MTGDRPHPCYLCGRPCWNKGCAECLRKGRGGGLSRQRNRDKKKRENMLKVDG